MTIQLLFTGTCTLREAAAALRRYEDSLFSDGGVAYFLSNSPEHGYQQMVVKSTVLYWDLTQDPYALSWLRRLALNFPNVQHRSGLLTDAEVPHLKHPLYKPLNPAVPAVLAAVLGDDIAVCSLLGGQSAV